MVSRAIWTLSVVASLFVLASFTMFAVDQLNGASKHSQAEVTANDAGGTGTVAAPTKKKEQAQPRAFIDSVAKALRSPFDAIARSASSDWAKEGIPTMIALLVYGFGLGYLARFSRGRA